MAWTITETRHASKPMKSQAGDEVNVIKLACVSDGSGCDYDLTQLSYIKNSWLWLVVCIPGTGGDQPSAAFQLQLQNELDVSLYDSGSGGIAHDANTVSPGTVSAGMPPPFFDTVSFVCGTLGDTNTADFYLYFTKGM